MRYDIESEVKGLAELSRGLKGVRRRLQRTTLRRPLRLGGIVLREAIRARAPVLNTSKRGGAWMKRVGARKVGLVKRATSVLNSRIATSRGNVGVFVTVRRPKATKRQIKEGGGDRKLAVSAKRRGGFGLLRKDGARGGTYYPNDPFYFRFLEEGTKNISPRKYRFIGLTAQGRAGREAVSVFVKEAAKGISNLKANEV
jgi:HK97 gp10 family phage protein